MTIKSCHWFNSIMLKLTYVPSSRSEARRTGAKKYVCKPAPPVLHTCFRNASSGECNDCKVIRYQTDESYRANRRRSVSKSKKRIAYKERQNSRKRERYATDEKFREKEKEISRKGARRRRIDRPEYHREMWREKYRRQKGTEEGRSVLAWRTLLSRCVRAGWKKNHSTEE